MTMPDAELLQRGVTLIEPFDAGMVQPASYDLGLDSTLLVPVKELCGSAVDLRKNNPKRLTTATTIGVDGFELQPGACVLGSTLELIHCPTDYVARVEGKSSLGRLFMTVHVTAGFIDPGFSGQVTLEIVNHGPWTIILWPGMRIAQVNFAEMSSPCLKPYGSPGLGSHYQGQKGPTPSAGNRNDEARRL